MVLKCRNPGYMMMWTFSRLSVAAETEAAEVLTEKNRNIRSILYKNHFDLILLDMNFNSAIIPAMKVCTGYAR